jgi:hypothetical protein
MRNLPFTKDAEDGGTDAPFKDQELRRHPKTPSRTKYRTTQIFLPGSICWFLTVSLVPRLTAISPGFSIASPAERRWSHVSRSASLRAAGQVSFTKPVRCTKDSSLEVARTNFLGMCRKAALIAQKGVDRTQHDLKALQTSGVKMKEAASDRCSILFSSAFDSALQLTRSLLPH